MDAAHPLAADAPAPSDAYVHRPPVAALSLAALGVVYGDIGTSPLYAIKECFAPHRGLPPMPANVLGILSLVLWSLLVVIVLKYLSFIMQAHNRGEGGILALMALLGPAVGWTPALISVGLFGAALLYGDGVITPAISVLSAMEGLKVATPRLVDYVVPATACPRWSSTTSARARFCSPSAPPCSPGRAGPPWRLPSMPSCRDGSCCRWS